METSSNNPSRRILFLDDDPRRAADFAIEHPAMLWVQTVDECLALLQEPWDEVHLDHDLAGEILVDSERNDCGMEIVRWLCEQPRQHLVPTEFFIHSHNVNAVCMMELHLRSTGYNVQYRPFGVPFRSGRCDASRLKRLILILRRVLTEFFKAG